MFSSSSSPSSSTSTLRVGVILSLLLVVILSLFGNSFAAVVAVPVPRDYILSDGTNEIEWPTETVWDYETERLIFGSYALSPRSYVASWDINEAPTPNTIMVGGDGTTAAPGLGPVVGTSTPMRDIFGVTLGHHPTTGALLGYYLAFNTDHYLGLLTNTPTYTFTRVAGDGTPAWNDATGGLAQVNAPRGMCYHRGARKSWVADGGNNRIRELVYNTGSSDLDVSTLAGTGVAGNGGGSALSATFKMPHSCVVGFSDESTPSFMFITTRTDATLRRLMPVSTTGTVTMMGQMANTVGLTKGLNVIMYEFPFTNEVTLMWADTVNAGARFYKLTRPMIVDPNSGIDGTSTAWNPIQYNIIKTTSEPTMNLALLPNGTVLTLYADLSSYPSFQVWHYGDVDMSSKTHTRSRTYKTGTKTFSLTESQSSSHSSSSTPSASVSESKNSQSSSTSSTLSKSLSQSASLSDPSPSKNTFSETVPPTHSSQNTFSETVPLTPTPSLSITSSIEPTRTSKTAAETETVSPLISIDNGSAADDEFKRVVLDPEVKDAVDGMISTGQTLKVFTGTTNGALVMGRNTVLLAALSCGERLEPLPFAANPTRITIGDTLYRWWLGVVVGDGVAVIGMCVVGSIFLAIVKWSMNPSANNNNSNNKSRRSYIVEVTNIHDASDADAERLAEQAAATRAKLQERHRVIQEKVIEKIATIWFICSPFLICGCVASLIYAFLPYGAAVNLPFGLVITSIPTIVPLWVFYKAKKLMKVVPSKKDVDKEGVENETTLTKSMTYLFGSYKNVEWVPKTQQEIVEEREEASSVKSDSSNKTDNTSLEAAFIPTREESSIVLNDDVWNEISQSSPPVTLSNSTSQSPITPNLSLQQPQQPQKANSNSKNNESQEAEDFSRQWGFLYEHTDSLVFAYMDIICNVLISFSAGLMQNPDASNTFCQANAIITLIVHVPPTIFVIVKRPLMSRFDLVVCVLLWLGSFISLLLVLLSFSSGSDLQNALDYFSMLLGILALLSGISDVARLIVHWVQKRNLKRRKKFGKSQVKNRTKEFEIDWSGLVAQNSADHNNENSNKNKNNKDFQFDELMIFLETPAEDPDDTNENDDVDDAVAAFMNEPPTTKPTAEEAPIQTTASDEELEEMITRNNNNDDNNNDDENEDDRIAIGAAKNEELEKRRRDMANMFSHG